MLGEYARAHWSLTAVSLKLLNLSLLPTANPGHQTVIERHLIDCHFIAIALSPSAFYEERLKNYIGAISSSLLALYKKKRGLHHRRHLDSPSLELFSGAIANGR